MVCAPAINQPADTLWVSAGDLGGTYNALAMYQQLGYAAVVAYGGTCGNICGYCEDPTSCTSPGYFVFDGSGACDENENGTCLNVSVMWLCGLAEY